MSEVELTEAEPVLQSTTEPDRAFSNKYLMAMVFDAGEKDGGLLGMKVKSDDAENAVTRHVYYMKQAGLDTFTYRSESGHEIIVLIGTGEDKVASGVGGALNFVTGSKPARGQMHKFADAINFPMLLDEAKAEACLEQGEQGVYEGRVFPDMNLDVTPFRPFQYIYGHYEWEQHDEVFLRTKPEDVEEDFNDDPFTDTIRIKLIYEMLRGKRKMGGCGFKLTDMVRSGKVKGLYPLHNRQEADNIWENFKFGGGQDKFDILRNYFGEKIALYFNFVAHIAQSLIVPSFLGLALQCFVWAILDYSHWSLCFFSSIMVTWSILMLEAWKNTEKHNALRWGTMDFDKNEVDRPEFKEDELLQDFKYGELKSDPHAKSMKFVDPIKARRRYIGSYSVVNGMILLVVGVVVGIYILRFALSESLGSVAATIASALNAVQIVVFNFLFSNICKTMTEYENQRTDTQYEDSLIGKLFFFQFVNSYSSFFFIAFIAQNMERPDYLTDDDQESEYVGECGWEDCMLPLSFNLLIIFLARLFVANAVNFLMPWYTHKTAKEEALKKCGHLIFSPAEGQLLLDKYDPIHDSIGRYSDLAVHFGFMSLFTTALPLATVFFLAECIVSARVDLYRFIHLTQRAMPIGASDIGTWMDVFSLLSSISVVTNAGLICFTMSVLKRMGKFSDLEVMWVFIGFQWFFLTLQVLIEKAIPDIDYPTTLQIERQEYIVSKVLEHNPDEVTDEMDGDSDDESGNAKVRLRNMPQFESIIEEYPTVSAESIKEDLAAAAQEV